MSVSEEPRRCRARRTRDGGVCQRRVKYGELRCKFHGGASPQAKRKAEAPREVASVMPRPVTDAERRNPWDTALDALQRLDSYMTSGELVGTQFIDHAEKLIKSCKLILDNGIAERAVLARDRDTAQDGRLITVAVVSGVDAALDQLDVTGRQRDTTRETAVRTATRSMQPQPNTIEGAAIESAPTLSLVASSHPRKRTTHTEPRSPRRKASLTTVRDQAAKAVSGPEVQSFDAESWARMILPF